MSTERCTMAQALLKFLANQWIEIDGDSQRFVSGIIGIFGHGNVTGLGEALEYGDSGLTFMQGHNEQGMVHMATAYAKQKNRLAIFACTSSIGPGATNMVTAAATATSNRIPVLLLPGDIFACRQPDPVLQQIEDPTHYALSANDCLRPVSRYWDRITRPEQLMTACLNAFRVLTDPIDTGAVTLCLPQDVQAEAYDYPTAFFEKRTWYLDRRDLSDRAVEKAVAAIKAAKQPLIIAGGGVHYSLACECLSIFADQFSIPVAVTQAGKSALPWTHRMNVGGLGVTGTKVANQLAAQADLIIAVGSRLQDFTTASKWAFQHSEVKILQLNVSAFDGYKMGATLLQADAKLGLQAIHKALGSLQLGGKSYSTDDRYQQQIAQWSQEWQQEVDRLYTTGINDGNSQTNVLGVLNDFVSERDVVVGAAGSLPGDLHRLWRSKTPKDYHLEYAYSCMGYEVAAGLGVKMAHPHGEVYVIVGDGSYLMLHSELLTSIQEGVKITIILLNNQGYQCIKGLQQSQGSRGFGNEFRYRDKVSQRLEGETLRIDFVQYARALGANAMLARDVTEFKQALADANQLSTSTLIEIRVNANSMSAGYESWWRVAVAEVSTADEVRQAYRAIENNVKQVKPY
ncbi:MAG: 3D-(3,5/4)-trihydroxycyclohexane-1,2-dione acylhydrolase (decyclizing) [Pseudomonadales bacterium]